MNLLSGLDHILVEAPAGCEEAARAFYSGIFGLPEIEKPVQLRQKGGVWFLLPDGRQLHVGVTADFVPRQKGHPAFRTESLDKVKQILEQLRIAYVCDHQADFPRIFLNDPWENRFEILERVDA